MKLADLKKLAVGTKLRVVHNLLGPCDKARVVARVQSNAVTFTGDGIKVGEVSWLYFPKARDFRDDGDGFTVLADGVPAASYKFEKEAR